MTSRTQSRIAGVAFLVYIAAGIGLMVFGAPTGDGDIGDRLLLTAQHAAHVRVTMIVAWLMPLCALVLAVTLYGITRHVDNELAAFVLACRTGEGVVGAASMAAAPALLWLATADGPGMPDPATARAIGGLVVKLQGWSTTISATLFAAGSTVFAWLLVRGRLVPTQLARLGVFASLLILTLLPLQLAGIPGGVVYMLMWLPMLVFEVGLAFRLIVRGVAGRSTDMRTGIASGPER